MAIKAVIKEQTEHMVGEPLYRAGKILNIHFLKYFRLIKRPNLAGAVLQTPLSLIN